MAAAEAPARPAWFRPAAARPRPWPKDSAPVALAPLANFALLADSAAPLASSVAPADSAATDAPGSTGAAAQCSVAQYSAAL